MGPPLPDDQVPTSAGVRRVMGALERAPRIWCCSDVSRGLVAQAQARRGVHSMHRRIIPDSYGRERP